MKLRIYYDGYYDRFEVQYKKWFIWYTFMNPDVWYADAIFDTPEEARVYLEHKISDILKKRKEKAEKAERHRLAKKRAKKSYVVYEEVI